MSHTLKKQIRALVWAGAGLALIGLAGLTLPGALAALNSAQPDFTAAPVAVLYPAPVLSLGDLQGDQHALADYRGRVVLVNLWATWCPPCQAEMPILQDFFERHRAQGFIIIAIDDGEAPPEVRAFAARYELGFPIWLDPTYEATDRAFRTRGLPSSYVIDRSGTVRLAWIGAITARDLERFVTPLIEE
jgi:thiol-disulfide isomerase/thioredoxin